MQTLQQNNPTRPRDRLRERLVFHGIAVLAEKDIEHDDRGAPLFQAFDELRVNASRVAIAAGQAEALEAVPRIIRRVRRTANRGQSVGCIDDDDTGG